MNHIHPSSLILHPSVVVARLPKGWAGDEPVRPRAPPDRTSNGDSFSIRGPALRRLRRDPPCYFLLPVSAFLLLTSSPISGYQPAAATGLWRRSLFPALAML